MPPALQLEIGRHYYRESSITPLLRNVKSERQKSESRQTRPSPTSGPFRETPTADTKFLPALIDFSVSKSTAAKRICLLHVTPSLPAVVALALSLPTSQHPPLTCTVGSRSPLPITRWSATPCQPLYVFSQQIFLRVRNSRDMATCIRGSGLPSKLIKLIKRGELRHAVSHVECSHLPTAVRTRSRFRDVGHIACTRGPGLPTTERTG